MKISRCLVIFIDFPPSSKPLQLPLPRFHWRHFPAAAAEKQYPVGLLLRAILHEVHSPAAVLRFNAADGTEKQNISSKTAGACAARHGIDKRRCAETGMTADTERWYRYAKRPRG